MSQFNDHIIRAKCNLQFLEHICNSNSNCWDWKTTVCFYVGVHLVNAHIANFGLHYRSHKDVAFAITSENDTSITKIGEKTFLSYEKLSQLSRRARYMVHENIEDTDNEKAYSTHEKHFSKSIRHLDNMLCYFYDKYSDKMGSLKDFKVILKSLEITQNENLRFFTLIK